MPVLMALRLGRSVQARQLASENADVLRGITERAQASGVIAHPFYGGDGQIMVVDEWPDEASFQAFWEAEQAAIGQLMAQVATGEPEITFWRKLKTGDEVGWE